MAMTAARSFKRTVRRTDTLPVAASTKILPGMALMLNSSGYLVEAADTANARTPCFSIEEFVVDNSAGSDGDKYCTVCIDGTIVIPLSTSPVTANLEADVYAVDGDTVTLTGSNRVWGKIVKISNVGDPSGRANSVEVEIGKGASF